MQLKNNSFEDTWQDSPVGSTVNQIPTSWELTYTKIGDKLNSENAFFDVDHNPKLITAKTYPECVHKGLFSNVWNLPEKERPGGSDPLVLNGSRVYKIFSNYNPFGVQLKQTLTLSPGAKYKVTWNVRVHSNPVPGGDASPGAAVWRIGLNNTFSSWRTFAYGLTDRAWVKESVEIIVPANGLVTVIGEFESRSEAGIDFFIDDIQEEYIETNLGNPREDYPRTYVLLPGKDKLTNTEFNNVLAEYPIYDNQFTVGFSADDAGIGNLSNKKVLVVSIHDNDWNKVELLDFFNKYYPGTIVEFIQNQKKVSFPVASPREWYCAQYFSVTHPGIDINLDKSPWGDVEQGYPIYAVLDGTVHYVTDAWSGVGMGVIKHTLEGIDYWVQYAHVNFTVKVGDKVTGGQVIGHIANYSGGDHLHFAVSTKEFTREYTANKYFIDPVPWLKIFLEPEVVDNMLAQGSAVKPTNILRSNNLIGLHSGYQKPGWDNYFVESKATLQKVFSAGFAVTAKKLAPEALVVYRKHVDPGIKTPVKDHAKEYAQLYYTDIELTARDLKISMPEILKYIDVIESLNEEIPTFNQPQIEKAVEFDCYFMEAVNELFGKEVSAGVLTAAVGNPHESEVKYLLPAVKHSITYNAFIAPHNYWLADANKSYLVDKWLYHAGRFTAWDNEFVKNGYYSNYYFGESGICFTPDGVNFNPAGGWKLCGSFEKYIQDLLTLNTLLLEWNKTHNNRVFGACIFGYGNWGWDSFEIGEGDLRLLLEQCVKHIV
jgi:murein DD-endopeptidase MepM/ murein hydrolase activator NlpD